MANFSKKLYEKEVYFSTVINPDEYPFWIPQYGITNKNVAYHEVRMDSTVTCIEYIIDGSGTIISNDNSFIVNKGDTYMLVEGKYHNYYSNPDDPFKKIWINVKGVLAKEIIRIYKLENTILFRNTDTLDIIRDIHNVCRTETNPQIIQDKVSAKFLNLIQFLYRNQRDITAASKSIDIFRNYIDCHITENIKLEAIAHVAHMSINHAIRTFKSNYGMTPHQYIIDSKMRIAKAMLKATNYPVAEIAASLGYPDPHNFSAQFQKHVGIRPSIYRKDGTQANKK